MKQGSSRVQAFGRITSPASAFGVCEDWRSPRVLGPVDATYRCVVAERLASSEFEQFVARHFGPAAVPGWISFRSASSITGANGS